MKTAILLLLTMLATPLLAAPKLISKVPFVINVPGTYLLNRDRLYTGTGYAITINTDNVVVDLGGNTLSGNPTIAQANSTAGIFAQDRRNITVRNGTVRSFARGVYLEGLSGSNHLVENIRADLSTFLGIQVKGNNSIVRQCRVTTVGGATAFRATRFGLHLTGRALLAEDNTILEVSPDASDFLNEAAGIYIENSANAILARNKVQNSATTLAQQSPKNYGIIVSDSPDVLVERNQVVGTAGAIQYRGTVSSNNQGGVYRDNSVLASGAGIAVTSGVKDGGGNVIGN